MFIYSLKQGNIQMTTMTFTATISTEEILEQMHEVLVDMTGSPMLIIDELVDSMNDRLPALGDDNAENRATRNKQIVIHINEWSKTESAAKIIGSQYGKVVEAITKTHNLKEKPLYTLIRHNAYILLSEDDVLNELKDDLFAYLMD